MGYGPEVSRTYWCGNRACARRNRHISVEFKTIVIDGISLYKSPGELLCGECGWQLLRRGTSYGETAFEEEW